MSGKYLDLDCEDEVVISTLNWWIFGAGRSGTDEKIIAIHYDLNKYHRKDCRK